MSLFIVLGFINVKISYSQTQYSYSHTKYTYGPYYFNQSMGFIQGLIQEKKNREREAAHAEFMKSKTLEIRNYYDSIKNPPVKILNGWHKVTIVAGENFIDYRKVLVENGKIQKMVWDDFMEENLTFGGKVEKGKSKASIQSENPNLVGLFDVYFFDFMADTTRTTTPPLKPAKIKFWTSSKDFERMYVSIDEDDKVGPFPVRTKRKSTINCDSKGHLELLVKPGSLNYHLFYSPKATRPESSGLLQLTEGECKVVYFK